MSYLWSFARPLFNTASLTYARGLSVLITTKVATGEIWDFGSVCIGQNRKKVLRYFMWHKFLRELENQPRHYSVSSSRPCRVSFHCEVHVESSIGSTIKKSETFPKISQRVWRPIWRPQVSIYLLRIYQRFSTQLFQSLEVCLSQISLQRSNSLTNMETWGLQTRWEFLGNLPIITFLFLQ